MRARKRLEIVRRLAVNLFFFPIARLAPRDRQRWVFGHAGDQFAGNPKHLFLWLLLHRPDIRATWISGSRRTRALLRRHRLPVAGRWTPGGMWAALRARVHAFSHDPGDVNGALGAGALRLDLWHGVGVKALHTGARPAGPLRSWLRGFVYLPHDLVVTTSDLMQAHFARAFALPAERCPQLGYPRLDTAADPALARWVRRIDLGEGFRLLPPGKREAWLYLPTFRDTGRPFWNEALPDQQRLGRLLAARRAVLYVKPHPRTPQRFMPAHPAILRWPDAIDFNAYLADLAGLITDYSSALYDYLAVQRRGAVLYPFDFDRYACEDRALVHDFGENVAGLRCNTFDALCDALASGAARDRDDSRVEDIRRRFWGGSPRPSSPAIVDFVERRLSA